MVEERVVPLEAVIQLRLGVSPLRELKLVIISAQPR
jgi:hypothetical protein